MIKRGASTTSALRVANAQAIFHALQDGQPWSVSQLCSHTGLTRPTVVAAGDLLVTRGLARRSPDQAPHRGRPGRRFEIASDARHVIGVDVDRDQVRAVLADLTGQVLARVCLRLTPRMRATQRIAKICAAAVGAAHEGELDPHRIAAVAVGTPGAVDPRTGAIGMCEALAGWSNLALRDRLTEQLEIPVLVENDANLAALAEHEHGQAMGSRHAVTLLVGQRPGAGVLIDGKLLHGHHGWAGELFIWDLWRQCDGRAHATPNHRWISHDAVMDLLVRGGCAGARATIDDRPYRDSGSAAIDLDAALTAAGAGDVNARDALDRFVRGAAWVITTIVSLLGPELVIVNGLPSMIAREVAELWQQAVDDRLPQNPARLVTSDLGAGAVALGAVAYALDHVRAGLFG